MTTSSGLAGRTILMSGGSRGIGLAIAVRAAHEGANIAFIAKTDQPHPKLPGTVHTAAAAIEEAGGAVLPIIGDIRDDDSVRSAVAATVDRFGGIDILVNNASAISLEGLGQLPLKRFDLMADINVRGTVSMISASLPHLLESTRPQVLSLAPPLNLDRRWLREYAPYTVSKYSMTMLTLGVAEQYREQGVAANCLWPATLIATAAVRNVVAGDEGMAGARRPEIMADAAAIILGDNDRTRTGETYLDQDVLAEAGIDDLTGYLNEGSIEEDLEPDLFVS